METDSLLRIVYLGVLLAAIGGWFIAENRMSWGKTARAAGAWVLIFLGAIAAYGLWGDIRSDVLPRQSVVADGVIEVPRGTDGHYHLTLRLNDVPVDFVVDTGASDIVLTREDAARVGIDAADLRFTGVAATANGTVRTARARVETIALGPVVDRDIAVSVNDGEMFGSLLGMAYLQRFDEIAISDGVLRLSR